jgi:hypothetical protein
LVLESYTQWPPKNSPAPDKKESKRIFNTNAQQLTQEVVERVHALLHQVLSGKWHNKVLAIAKGIVTTTTVAGLFTK